MRILRVLSLFFFVANFVGMHMALVSGKCQSDQKSLLLQMKNTLIFNSSLSTRLVQWSPCKECCAWSGVDCDEAGHVIGLDLSEESISRGIENSTVLFGLRYLQRLNLAFNLFDEAKTQIPSSLANLTNLTYLNLSFSGFGGQIPYAISGMTKLFTLDLSTSSDFGLKLEKPNLSMLVQNLTELRELYLDGVNISANGNEWCQALSSSLPNLQVLNLSDCFLSGPICSSLASLRSLSKIHLDHNILSSSVPDFLGDYVNLTSLSLGSCELKGTFPEKIFQVPTLETLDLSFNPLLEGFLPDFPKNASFRVLNLARTSFSGALPDSFGNLRILSTIDLQLSNFSGPIPTSIANLTQLVHLDLSSNHFIGAISSIGWEELLNLDFLDLSYNSLKGRIPAHLFSFPSLEKLWLNNNQFEGQVPQILNASSLVLQSLGLERNKLEGKIPMSVFELRNLEYLSLSYNRLALSATNDWSFPSQIRTLELASCGLKVFPNLRNQSKLDYLDLSNNKISGKIPNWIWDIGNGNLFYLNLSHNLLVDLEKPYSISHNLKWLDLHSNLLRGKIPHAPNLFYVDYSSNFFSSISADIGNFLFESLFFAISNNSLKGVIPKSICNATRLQLLDLSHNNFNGMIPGCLTESIKSLDVLNLRRNKLNGYIPDKFPIDCALTTLDLSGNQLEGMVPKSLANCKNLELLDLGNNQIIDKFPCWIQNVSSMRVLVLRSNKFYEKIGCLEKKNSWSMLRIMDLSSNNFTGRLPQKSLKNWKPMTLNVNKAQSQFRHGKFYIFADGRPYYQDVVTITMKKGINMELYDSAVGDPFYQDTITITNKGLKMEVGKNLQFYTSIDLSCNHFQGPIPKEVGTLKSLLILNLSHNDLTGQIPSSIENLRALESFDLSFNNLSGAIPSGLAKLNFLSSLNLSYNHFVGRIPLGTQLQSFLPTSFEGNQGLCGPPVTDNCTNLMKLSTPAVSNKAIDWKFVLMTIGFVIGFGAVVTPLMFCEKVNKWHDNWIDKNVKDKDGNREVGAMAALIDALGGC